MVPLVDLLTKVFIYRGKYNSKLRIKDNYKCICITPHMIDSATILNY